MTLEDFKASVSENQTPQDISSPLLAMWYDAQDDWDSAHDIAQDLHTNEGSWIHAYLHRKEGDIFNARYWYSRAGKEEYKGALEDEWEYIVSDLLNG